MRNKNAAHDATAAQDARLLLQLDRLREETEMRKARRWWRDQFWPRTARDYLKIEMAHGSQENKWLRQVATYWGMAASFVIDRTLSEKAFLQPKFSDEMFEVFAKVRPFLKQLRERTQNPDFMGNVEKVILSSKMGRERLRAAEIRPVPNPKPALSLPAITGMDRQPTNSEGNRERT